MQSSSVACPQEPLRQKSSAHSCSYCLPSCQWSILQSPGSSNGLKGSEVWPNKFPGDTDAETGTSSSITRIKIKEVPVQEFAANAEL